MNCIIQQKKNNRIYHHEVERAGMKLIGIDNVFNKIVSENVINLKTKHTHTKQVMIPNKCDQRKNLYGIS